jgi:anthranilate phosphoribosyltransferase
MQNDLPHWTTWLPQAFAGVYPDDHLLPLLAQLTPDRMTASDIKALWQWLHAQLPAIPGITRFAQRLDTCGTGGSGLCHFNTSTTVALLLASMGHTVTKFGNRAATSQTGSFDFLAGLGLASPLPLDRMADALEDTQLALVYAPQCLPGLAHLTPARKQLGCRTVFNLLGPLLNPCKPTHQIVGHAGLAAPLLACMADILAPVNAWLVSGYAGQDDVTPWGETRVLTTLPAQRQDYWLTGASPLPAQPWADDAAANVNTFWAMAQGRDTDSPAYQLVCLNAAACLALLQGLTPDEAYGLVPLVKAQLSTGALAQHTRHVQQVYARLTA